jgi:hypothetical protein
MPRIVASNIVTVFCAKPPSEPSEDALLLADPAITRNDSNDVTEFIVACVACAKKRTRTSTPI